MKYFLRVLSILAVAALLPACGSGDTTVIQQNISNPNPPGGSGGFEPSAAITSNPSAINDEAKRIAVDANFMYILGFQSGAGTGWRIEKRSLSDGSLDPGFGAVGAVSYTSGAGDDAFDMAIDATDMYVAGYQANSQWRVEKRSLSTGALVSSFDGDGVVNVDPSGSMEEATAIALDATSVYIAGTDNVGGASQWRIEKRSKSNGGLDIAFNGTGVVQVNPSGDGNIDRPLFLRVSGTSLFAAGLDQTVGTAGRWRIEKRNLSDGALVPAFDGDGILTIDLSPAFPDTPTAFAATDIAIFIGGHNTTAGNWRVEKRSATTGVLDVAFDGDGVLTGGGVNDVPFALVVDTSAVYIGLAMEWGSFPKGYWKIEKRDLATGALLPDFGINGVVISDPSSLDDALQGMTLDSTFVYAVGFDSYFSQTNRQWRIEKRYK